MMDWLFKHFMKIWVIWVIICLGIFATIIYVAIHFLAKVW